VKGTGAGVDRDPVPGVLIGGELFLEVGDLFTQNKGAALQNLVDRRLDLGLYGAVLRLKIKNRDRFRTLSLPLACRSLRFDISDKACRNPGNHRIVGDVLCHDAPGTDNGVFTDGDATKDRRTRAD